MSFSIGQQVGPYRIELRIGQGGMATVYKAYHASLDRYVAIKVMHIALSEDPSFLERFRREAQIVGRLSHPHIIPIYDFSTFENQPYLVMKYVEGETLKQRMRREPLTLEEVTKVIEAVASALDYAHQNDVLHRDVKPSNIILDTDGTPYLTDFGLARVASLGESTLSADVMLGTPQYISPEQARGVRDLDAGTDIYSLGVVLYELVVGRVPFTSDTPYTIIHDHIYKPLPLPTYVNPSVSPAVEQVLVKALSKERSQRYTSAGDLAKAFRNAVQQSNMIEISLHTMRPEAFDEPQAAAFPQPPAIPSPLMPNVTPSGTVLVPGSSANYRVNQATGNGWVITGCLLFIVTCLISAVILLSAMNDERIRMEWDEAQAADANDTILIDDMATDELTAEVLFLNAEADTLKQEQVTLFQEVYPNALGGQLAQVYLSLEAEDASGAAQALRDAVSNEEPDPNLMSQWAGLLIEHGYDEPALVLFTAAYTRGFEDPEIREEAGEYLYNQMSGLRGPDIGRMCALYEQVPASPQLYMLAAQALISTSEDIRPPDDNRGDRPNLDGCPNIEIDTADKIIERGLTLAPDMAELYLVLGNYYESIGEMESAIENWQVATGFENAPHWVVSKATVKLDQTLS